MEHFITETDDPDIHKTGNPSLGIFIAIGVSLVVWAFVWWGAVTTYRILGALYG